MKKEFKPVLYRDCLIETNRYGYYVTIHSTAGRLMADTIKNIKGMILEADKEGK
jgi:ribosomal protein L31